MKFEDIINDVFEKEGGYVNDPKDPGGETKYGISKRAFPNVDIKSITKEDAKKIYMDNYWTPSKSESIPENLNFTKSEQSGKDYFCGVRGDWVPSTESEVSTENLGKHCSERVGESQCTGTSVGDQIPCKWVSYEEDEDEKSDMLGKCIPRCPTKYYSETEGRCLEVQKGNTPVQTSSIYKTCKIVSEDECRLSPICQPWEYAGEEFCGPRDPNADPDADLLRVCGRPCGSQRRPGRRLAKECRCASSRG